MQTRKKGTQLYNSNPKGKPKMKTYYGNPENVRKTLKQLRTKPRDYQMQVATTMYYRAKHHKHQTSGMRKSMKLYKKYIHSLKIEK